jgi:sec-independent protein translocase protein TatC
VQEEKLPVTTHLEEFRWRLIKCFIAIAVGFGGSFFYAERIFDFLARPLMEAMPKGSKLIFTSPPEAFFTYMKVLLHGDVVTTPSSSTNLEVRHARAVPNERKYVCLPPGATFFFLAGVSFGFFVVLPVGFKFFLGYTYTSSTIMALPSMREYLGFTMKFLLGFGFTFELPVFIYFLARMGVVNAAMLRKNRKYAILIIAGIAGMLTPGPDVLSQSMLGLPLYLLYE